MYVYIVYELKVYTNMYTDVIIMNDEHLAFHTAGIISLTQQSMVFPKQTQRQDSKSLSLSHHGF